MANFYNPNQQPKSNLVQPGGGFTTGAQAGGSLNPYEQATSMPNPAAGTPFYKPPQNRDASGFLPQNTSGPAGVGTPTPGGEGVLSGAGYNEDWYKTYGQDLMKDPSASEQLFQAGMSASNPFYDYAEKMSAKGINDDAAARGNFNSSFTLNRLANSRDSIRGAQAKELGDRAGQSDAARAGRYDASGRFARDAQDSTENRVRQATGGYMDLARGQSGLVDNFYGKAGDISNKANMAALEAALKEAGLSASEIQNLINNVLQAGGVASKFA